MLDTIKKIIILILALGGLFVLYSAFFKKDDTTSLLKTQTVASGDVLGADIVKAINQIKSLELKRDVFNDPIFKTLIDRSEVLAPQPKGRINPFATIGANPTTNTASTTTNVTR